MSSEHFPFPVIDFSVSLRPRPSSKSRQGLHFSYSVGALLGPAAVGQFGYRNVLVVFGVLAIPASLVSFVADGGDDSESASGWHLPVSAQETILQEVFDETTSSTESTASSESDADIIEGKAWISVV